MEKASYIRKNSFRIKTKLILFSIVITLCACIDNYNRGISEYNNKNYEAALKFFKRVDSTNQNYKNAQIKIKELDTLVPALRIDNVILRLNNEIAAIDKFDGNNFRNEISLIQAELNIIDSLYYLAMDTAYSYIKDIDKLRKQFKNKFISFQKSEFPKMRKNYGKILKDKLWVDNIKVNVLGTSNTILQFEGAIFASNRNIKDMQDNIYDVINKLRFKKVNYKWYKYDDEYTYFDIDTKKDSDI